MTAFNNVNDIAHSLYKQSSKTKSTCIIIRYYSNMKAYETTIHPKPDDIDQLDGT